MRDRERRPHGPDPSAGPSTRSAAALLLATLLAAPGLASAQAAPCPAPWRLEETFRLGSLEGADALNRVVALELDGAGSVYLAQAWIPWVGVFDREGRPLRRIGSAGQGPGGFGLHPLALGWKGDTLWVVEPMATTHLFGPAGTEVSRVRFRTPVPREGSVFTPGPLLRDGSLLGSRILGGTPETNGGMSAYFSEGRRPILRFSREGAILDTIAVVGWSSPRWAPFEFERAGRRVKLPLEHPLQAVASVGNPAHLPFALAPDGSAVFFVEQGPEPERARFSPFRIFDRLVGSRGTFTLLKIRIDGDTILARSIEYEREPIGPAEASWLRESFGKYAAGDYARAEGPASPVGRPDEATRARQRDAASSALVLPEHFPPVRAVVAGHDGSVWLLRELRADRADLWEIYDESGRLDGSVLVPDGRSSDLPWFPRMWLLRATRGEAWGMTLDDLDVPTLRRFRVARTCR